MVYTTQNCFSNLIVSNPLRSILLNTIIYTKDDRIQCNWLQWRSFTEWNRQYKADRKMENWTDWEINMQRNRDSQNWLILCNIIAVKPLLLLQKFYVCKIFRFEAFFKLTDIIQLSNLFIHVHTFYGQILFNVLLANFLLDTISYSSNNFSCFCILCAHVSCLLFFFVFIKFYMLPDGPHRFLLFVPWTL